MKKILFLLLLIPLFGIAQKVGADVIKFDSITSTVRDTYDVPYGENWLIWNGTTGQFENADGTDVWSAFGGAGDVTKVGTPVDNQIGVWTGDGTLEGDTNLQWTGAYFKVTGTAQITTGADVLNIQGNDISFSGSTTYSYINHTNGNGIGFRTHNSISANTNRILIPGGTDVVDISFASNNVSDINDLTVDGNITVGTGDLDLGGNDLLNPGSLGTPTSLTLTNATGLPLTTGVTGVLPIANIATGTPDGTKFVRDDGTLAVPSGAGDFLADGSVAMTGAMNFGGNGASNIANLQSNLGELQEWSRLDIVNTTYGTMIHNWQGSSYRIGLASSSWITYDQPTDKWNYDGSEIVNISTAQTLTNKTITLDASGFSGNLTTSDDTLQEVADAVDGITGTGGDSWSDPVDSDIIPDTDLAYDLGAATDRFGSIYINNIQSVNDLAFTPTDTPGGTPSEGWIYADDSENALKYYNGTSYQALLTDGSVSQETIEDFVGGMVTGNSETKIDVTYDDSGGKLDFSVDDDLSGYDNTTSQFIVGTEGTRTNVIDVSKVYAQTEADIATDGAPPSDEFVICTDCDPATTITGTVINMSGYYQIDDSSVDTATFTLTDVRAGGYAEVLINEATEPAVTGATQMTGTADFIAATPMLLCLKAFGTTVYYYFVEL